MPDDIHRPQNLLEVLGEERMIALENVSHDFGDFSLKDVSLSVEEGEYFVIIGPTGAGKTLILETMAGFYTPRQGRIILNGMDAARLQPEERNIGFVYQDYVLFPHLTVEENIAFGLKMRNIDKPEVEARIRQVMEMLKIGHLADRRPTKLSGGEQQRVALARALVIEPRILLLDEPLSALDTNTKEALREELRRIHTIKGTTTIHVTHDQTDALMLADRVAIIIDGEIAQVGTPQQVFNEPASVRVADFTGMENVLEGKVVSSSDGVSTVDMGGYYTRVVSEITEDDVYVFVRPEDVILSMEQFDSSARNTLECRVERVTRYGPIYRIYLDKGFSALVTKQSVEELSLKPGLTVYASFKATAGHLIKKR
jgi:molybdate/tungstate transport system ATP-binding protein